MTPRDAGPYSGVACYNGGKHVGWKVLPVEAISRVDMRLTGRPCAVEVLSAEAVGLNKDRQ